jgi:lipopolysaccharide/colanic/teichoic acid biosynthesis glycosyltransferase
MGPVIVHRGAVIEEAATIIGPAVVGAGAAIGRGALVAQCLVGPGAVVPPLAQIRHRIWFGDDVEGTDLRDADAIGARTPIEASRSDSAPIDLDRPASDPSLPYMQIKLCLDVLVAVAGLLLLAPALLLIALLVKLTSRGPVLYGDPREGKDARVFRCWKFRTMQTGTDALQHELYAQNSLDGPQFKLKDDPRVTPLGRWLRRSNLDEVPQLFNVAFGQMSLVGPRPSPFRENQICVPWREARLSVRPGITGLWQLCRDDRSSGDFHQWISYDVLYVRHISLWTDVKILFATVVTLGGRWPVPPSRLVPEERDDE